MQVFLNHPIYYVSSTLLVLFFTGLIHQSQAKNHRYKSLARCQHDECQLRPEHFALYSYVKNGVDSNFDLKGKELYPFLRSVELLERRFTSHEQKSILSGTALILSLLSNQTLKDALKVFKSPEGLALIDFYRSSVNGRKQNLACSELRVRDLERISEKLLANQQLAHTFHNIHQNFLKKSAKKCLKHSCSALDASMSKLDSVLALKYQASSVTSEASLNLDDETTSEDTNISLPDGTKTNQTSSSQSESSSVNKLPGWVREFEKEELELCQFFQRNNQSDCQVSGNELSEISLLKGRQEDESELEKNKTSPSLSDYLKSYYVNKILSTPKASDSETGIGSTATSVALKSELFDDKYAVKEAGLAILTTCRVIQPTLDYNLAALKWYSKQNLIENHKLATRSFWCPSLSYWLQLDRLCNELESSLAGISGDINSSSSSYSTNGTFTYEITTNRHYMDVVHN